MDRDEEKDLYIKSKIKDGHIPEKIDNLFNNFSKLVENEGGSYMEENNQPQKKNKNQIIFKRIAAVAACAVIALGGGNIYATTQGYDNVFFMIKEWIAPSNDVYGKDDILSDRDITISYKSIEIAQGIKMQINRLVVKDNEATLHLKIDVSGTDLDITPFIYVVRDENGNKICDYTSTKKETIYTELLKLKGLNKNAKKLELEVKQNDDTTLVKFEIDLDNKEIQVIGNEYELQKVSEEELKKYLSAFALLNYEDDILNAGTVDKDILVNVRKMLVARQLSKELDLDFYIYEDTDNTINNIIDVAKANSLIKSFSNIELEQDGLMKLDNIFFIESTENGDKVYLEMIENQTAFGINSLCIDVTNIMYSNGIYTVTFTYCYPTTEDINEDRIEELPIYEMTLGLTLNEEQTYSKYRVSTKMESQLVEAGKETIETDIIDVTAKCKETLEGYLNLLGVSESSPELILEELGIEYSEIEELKQNGNLEDGYINTTIKYQEFEKLILKYMTKEIYIKTFQEGCYKEIDGYLAIINGGGTGYSCEINEMTLLSDKLIYKVNVTYKHEVEKTKCFQVEFVEQDGNYVVSNIEYLENDITNTISPTVDDLKKFIGKWQLEYAIGNYGYEQKISDLHGGNGITITINEDGTFTEFVQDTELLMGKYTKLNENTIKRVYEDGLVVYTTYSINSLGENVISNTSRANQTITEYYSQKDVSLYETKDYFIGDWWRTLNNGEEEVFEHMISIRSDGVFLIVETNKIIHTGTYLVKENGDEDVPKITLQFNDGTNKELKLMQGSESHLMTEDLKEQYQYYSSVG